MYGNGLLKKLPTPTCLVAFVGAITIIPARACQLLAVAATIRVIRSTTVVSESHFIKVDLSTGRDKL